MSEWLSALIRTETALPLFERERERERATFLAPAPDTRGCVTSRGPSLSLSLSPAHYVEPWRVCFQKTQLSRRSPRPHTSLSAMCLAGERYFNLRDQRDAYQELQGQFPASASAGIPLNFERVGETSLEAKTNGSVVESRATDRMLNGPPLIRVKNETQKLSFRGTQVSFKRRPLTLPIASSPLSSGGVQSLGNTKCDFGRKQTSRRERESLPSLLVEAR